MPRPLAHASIDSRWGVHPMVDYSRSIISKMEERTGRSLEEWIAFAKKHGPKDESGRRAWLKSEHGLGSNTAWWISEMVEDKGWDAVDPNAYLRLADQYFIDMFPEKKAHLLPIAEAIIEIGEGLGSDVKVCPCQTIIPLYRHHVFAEIKPTTLKRIDLGFAFGNTPPSDKLIDTGGFAKKNRISHRIPLESVKDITGEVKKWLKEAYKRDA